jgi:flavin reductase (DIM6/NTAB) family NADH-FMN oxidoreductase RutF
MGYLGRVSGRDEDKITKVGFHISEVDGAPTFEEGKMVLVCKKLMETPLNPDDFKESWIEEKWYESKDFHVMYTAEILGAYRIEG